MVLQVGKAYLYLSRVYQCLQTPEYYQRAQQTLKHAYEICNSCSVSPLHTALEPHLLILNPACWSVSAREAGTLQLSAVASVVPDWHPQYTVAGGS